MEEKEIPGVVNKPQYDTDVFKPGRAILIKRTSGPHASNLDSKHYNLNNVEALIETSYPLKITVLYVNKHGERETVVIPIKLLAKEYLEIEFLN